MAILESTYSTGGLRFKATFKSGALESIDVWKKAGWSSITKEELAELAQWARTTLGLSDPPKPQKTQEDKVSIEGQRLPDPDVLSQRRASSTTELRVIRESDVPRETVMDLGKAGGWGPVTKVKFPMPGEG